MGLGRLSPDSGDYLLKASGQTGFPSENLDERQREITHYGILSYLHSMGSLDYQISAFGRYSSLFFTPGNNVGDILYNGLAQTAYKRDVAYGYITAEKAIELYPESKRALLTAYADTTAAIDAINEARIHYYLMKPWDPPEEKLFPAIDELLTACWHYLDEQNGRSVTFEYVMLDGINDFPEQARMLAGLLKGHPAKVNLIPFNPFPGTIKPLGASAPSGISVVAARCGSSPYCISGKCVAASAT